MCGISGFVGFSNNLKLAEMANKVQRHRGPDNQSVWSDNYLAFAHQRLSIIDLSEQANQPFIKHNIVLIFNGEIYNFHELKEKLVKEKGVTFTTQSDTEVVLEMYYHYKEKALKELRGMFTFAIYETDAQTLFIARDPFGIKPLFYTQINNAFAFSSELKTLVQVDGFDKRINMDCLVSALNYLWVAGNDTMFMGCHKLPPAHYIVLKKNKPLQIAKYWELSDTELNAETLTEQQLAKDVFELIHDSVEKHMIADVPVATFLSGGLDSSLISAIAKEYASKLTTYTIGTSKNDQRVEQMPEDEKYARMLADKLGFDHHEIVIEASIIDMLPKMVRFLDEPIGDPAALNTFLICDSARKNGLKVLLSGMGADEIFFGYRRHKATMLALKYQKIPKPVRKVISSVVNMMPVKLGRRGLKYTRWAKRFISFADLPLEESYRRSYSYYDKNELQQLLKNNADSSIESVYSNHRNIFYSKFKNDPINRICNTDINLFMLGLNLTYTDRASMAASVEVRVPFIDIKVIEAVMKIPGTFKNMKGEPKYILKKAAENVLPHEIIYRKKASFGAPIRSWISNELRSMVDDLLSEKAIESRGIFNYKYIQSLIQDDRNGVEDNAYRIYQLLTIELWFREFVDNTSAIPNE